MWSEYSDLMFHIIIIIFISIMVATLKAIQPHLMHGHP